MPDPLAVESDRIRHSSFHRARRFGNSLRKRRQNKNDNIGALRRSEQKIERSVRINRIARVVAGIKRNRRRIVVDCDRGQEASFRADLVHGRTERPHLRLSGV